MYILVPPRTVVTERHMHRALRIPEILLNIFSYVTDDSGKSLLPTLAAIARTCQSFQKQVEQILWYEISDIKTLYHVLPPRVLSKNAWSFNRRALSGSQWTRFMDRARCVRVLAENNVGHSWQDEACASMFIAMARSALREPLILTPYLRELEWKTTRPCLGPAINLFIGSSLQSLAVDVKLLTNYIIRTPLGVACPRLKHLKISGNGRSSTGTISNVLRTLHCLETLTCSSLDNDAFAHLARLKCLSYLAVDMRWSMLNLEALALRDSLRPGSFHNLHTLYWKDYDIDSLTDIFLMPDIPLSDVYLEIESYCTSPSLRTFLQSFTGKFPHIQAFSLVHDVKASSRFGLQASAPGPEHHLDECDLEPLLSLKSLRVLKLADLGDLVLDDDLIRTIASESPGLEQLSIGTNIVEIAPGSVTFEGLLSLLQQCPHLLSLGLTIDVRGMLTFSDTSVCHERLTHLRLYGSILGRREEVDKMLRRVLPGLRTVEESLDGVIWRMRTVGEQNSAIRLPTSSGRGRRIRYSE